MDMEYHSPLFENCNSLIQSIESLTLLPYHNLHARALLSKVQLAKVKNIRNRRLTSVIRSRFIPD